MSGDVTYDIFFGIIILMKHEEEVRYLCLKEIVKV